MIDVTACVLCLRKDERITDSGHCLLAVADLLVMQAVQLQVSQCRPPMEALIPLL